MKGCTTEAAAISTLVIQILIKTRPGSWMSPGGGGTSGSQGCRGLAGRELDVVESLLWVLPSHPSVPGEVTKS